MINNDKNIRKTSVCKLTLIVAVVQLESIVATRNVLIIFHFYLLVMSMFKRMNVLKVNVWIQEMVLNAKSTAK